MTGAVNLMRKKLTDKLNMPNLKARQKVVHLRPVSKSCLRWNCIA